MSIINVTLLESFQMTTGCFRCEYKFFTRTISISQLISHYKMTNTMRIQKLTRLNYAIKNIIAIGGLALVSSATWAEAYINPNEIWLDSGPIKGLCAKDIDQDGDLDIFTIHHAVVNIIENIGTPMSPQFSTPKAFLSNPSHVNLNRAGMTECDSVRSSVDIDGDGDLDLFHTSDGLKTSGVLSYMRNDNSTEHPFYSDENSDDLFGLSRSYVANIVFKDIDGDSDLDAFINGDIFYENAGAPKNPQFVKQEESPVRALCQKYNATGLHPSAGLIVDLNNDGRWDSVCYEGFKGTVNYIEATQDGYLPEKNIATLPALGIIKRPQITDVDDDGDLDIIIRSMANGNIILYTNLGLGVSPQFSIGKRYTLEYNPTFGDLNADGAIDYIFLKERHRTGFSTRDSPIGLAMNIGDKENPKFSVNNRPTKFEQCNNSIFTLKKSKGYSFYDTDLVDVDGDGDLDLFVKFRFFSDSGIAHRPLFLCKNQGTATAPYFSQAVVSSFDSPLYKNISNAKKINLGLMSSKGGSNFDLNADGQLDSTLIPYTQSTRLIKNTSEPITNFAVERSERGGFFIVTSRNSYVDLQKCGHLSMLGNQTCGKKIILPSLAQEVSLANGYFFKNKKGYSSDIALATTDLDGNLAINIFGGGLNLIGSANAGQAHSISIAAGQFDVDLEDEFAVSFVKPDNTISVIIFNLDGSIVSQTSVGQGKQPSIAVGNFSGAGDNTYVISYLSLDNQLKSAIFHGNGSLISESTIARKATYTTVTSANLLGTGLDDYIVSLTKPDGTAGLIGFSSNSTFLAEIYGGINEQPRVTSKSNTKGNVLAVSLIQPDKKPAIIFLDNQGNYKATAVGLSTATLATVKLLHVDIAGVPLPDQAVLVYIDEVGRLQQEYFDMNGVRL